MENSNNIYFPEENPTVIDNLLTSPSPTSEPSDDSPNTQIPTTTPEPTKPPSSNDPSKDSQNILRKFTQGVTDVASELLGTQLRSAVERPYEELTQQLHQMERMIDEMLGRLGEYCELLDLIRSQTSQTLNQNLPKAFEVVQEMSQMYQRIDRLEGVVSNARACTLAMEEAVSLAESELTPSTKHAIKTFLKSLSPFSIPRSESADWAFLHFEEPELFVADKQIHFDQD